jgi:hypothetical protein
MLSVLAAATISVDAALAQGDFPAPLPGQGATTGVGPLSAPPLADVTPVPAPECTQGFSSLREDADNKGKMIKAARERHASPEEACKFIGAYSAAEVKMMKYVEANAAGCGIPGSVMNQLKAGHKNTEGLLQKVCSLAEQIKTRGSGGQINDFGDPALWKGTPRGPVGDFSDTHGRF